MSHCPPYDRGVSPVRGGLEPHFKSCATLKFSGQNPPPYGATRASWQPYSSHLAPENGLGAPKKEDGQKLSCWHKGRKGNHWYTQQRGRRAGTSGQVEEARSDRAHTVWLSTKAHGVFQFSCLFEIFQNEMSGKKNYWKMAPGKSVSSSRRFNFVR